MDGLDLDAVKAFVLTADFKSFTRAAEALETTQSAISLKIKRLEHRLGRRLLERTPRLVRLSADGTVFLCAARSLVAAHGAALAAFTVERRRLVVGISHHVVGAELPLLLKQVSDAEPGLLIEMRLDSSREVLAALDAGTLDAGIVLRHDLGRRDGELVAEAPFAWMGAPDFDWCPGAALRLATQAEPCNIRTMAVEALDGVGLVWTEVFVGGGVATIGAAVSAGLAVAALARHVAPAGTIDVGARLGLPPLPSRDIVLYTSVTDAQARRALKALRAAFRATR